MLATALEATELSKSYGAGAPLFSNLSVRAQTGLVAVAGKNGSGKTTLLKILASLIRPRTGRVRLLRGGAVLSGDARRQAVGWSGPDLSLYDDFTAEENLTFFQKAAGAPRDHERIGELLDRVGLRHAARLRVGAFSTGMKQRLRIAFAVLLDPPILILDEPMTGLDAEGRAAVEDIVSRHRCTGAVVLASNDPRDFQSPEQVIELGETARRKA